MDQIRLAPCPHCGTFARLVDTHNGYAIVCGDKNCLGQMRVQFGSCDDKKLFLQKLVADWNRRIPDIKAVTAAIDRVQEYRDHIYEETQEEYDNHGGCCVDVLDETLNIMNCFTAYDYAMEDEECLKS